MLSSVLEKRGKPITVRAFPLYAILKALDVPVIDYFSLDIEGVELEVSNTLFVRFEFMRPPLKLFF